MRKPRLVRDKIREGCRSPRLAPNARATNCPSLSYGSPYITESALRDGYLLILLEFSTID